MQTKKRRVVCDTETDGLEATRIWCIACKDLDSGEVFSWDVLRDNLRDAKSFLEEECEEIVGHNFLQFDLPVLERLLSLHLPVSRITDTLVLSQLFNSLREHGNSLEEWAKIFGGDQKIAIEDWTSFSPEMLRRCIGDLNINERLYYYLLNEGKKFSKASIRLEHDVTHILRKMRENGFYLYEDKARELQSTATARLNELRERLVTVCPPVAKPVREVKYRVNADGSLYYHCFAHLPPPITKEDIWGDYTLIEWVPFNIGSPSQVVERMNKFGWKPYLFTKSGAPRVCLENLATLSEDAPEEAKLIPRYLGLADKERRVNEWLTNLSPVDGRVHGMVISCGASTHRMAHFKPNMANVPSIDSELGKESRACWGVEDPIHYSQVGCDAKGIQLRVLAHYMNDPEYTDIVCNGDPHTKNMEAAGLDSRAVAKRFIYAWLLGAGASKIGEIIGAGAKEGAEVMQRFLDNLPALKRVKDRCKFDAKRGYTIGFDGRIIPIRSEHYALAIYLQGGESCIMKLATTLWYREVIKRKLDARLVAMVHDEWQTEVLNEQAEEVGKLQAWSIGEAGRLFKLNCPMDGDYRIGKNWLDCH